jgi:acyl-[acyl-carrier-protein] desaturase
LFEHFASVAQRLKVYTAFDYASIVRHLVATWKVPTRSVSGKAAAAQEFLCRQAERLESLADYVGAEAAKQPPTKFSWIHDRTA